ncbi:MAG: hypothetical protein LBH24_06700 [Clostridiales bacterium]|nr:hypothetical protein [Clostridiales bacterium]
MKKKGLLLVTSLLLVCAVAGAGVVYALWWNDATNTGNKVTVGGTVTLSLNDGGTAYFSNVTLAGPNSETQVTTITVTNSKNASYVLKIAEFSLSDAQTAGNYTATDLYIKVATSSGGIGSAAAVKFEDGVELIAANTDTSKTIYVVIGIGTNVSASMADQVIEFSITTAAAPQA